MTKTAGLTIVISPCTPIATANLIPSMQRLLSGKSRLILCSPRNAIGSWRCGGHSMATCPHRQRLATCATTWSEPSVSRRAVSAQPGTRSRLRSPRLSYLQRRQPGTFQVVTTTTFFLRELTGSHARALIAARVTDVNSSDQHAIKPWFSTRTALAPRIVDLTSEEFPLVGGRLDVIGKIPVPTLVYGHGGHFISLTEMPASVAAGTSLGQRSIDGFHVIGWSGR